jgi:hypothetical protein
MLGYITRHGPNNELRFEVQVILGHLPKHQFLDSIEALSIDTGRDLMN